MHSIPFQKINIELFKYLLTPRRQIRYTLKEKDAWKKGIQLALKVS